MTRAAKALTPGAEIEADRDPPGMVIADCALAPVGIEGNACEILTAVLDACVAELWDPERSARHVECLGRGDAHCAWQVVEAADAEDAATERVEAGAQAAG
ncbi:MAG: hypothetical protein ACOC9N_02815, partial [Gemmatimonadota bacterium]